MSEAPLQPSATAPAPLAPGGILGILGGGQLGRMTALAARRLGYSVHVFEPEAGCPAGQVADREINAPYSDQAALRDFASGVDRITLEFENIPASVFDVLEPLRPVFPNQRALHICQHRQREKTFLRDHGFTCASFAVVASAEELADAHRAMGDDAVLKTAAFGYDGKGQIRLHGENQDYAAIWKALAAQVGVLEKWIHYERECSVICARSTGGETRAFDPVDNEHRNQILHCTSAPSSLPRPVQQEAQRVAIALAEALDVIGLLAVEFFVTHGGDLLVNEMAPRPHNSGHHTLDAGLTSQFEQHVRAVCGLPLGDTRLLSPAVMVNLLGDLWPSAQQAPDWTPLLSDPTLKLHLYGKKAARPGRKMGHFCVLDPDRTTALQRAHKHFDGLNPSTD